MEIRSGIRLNWRRATAKATITIEYNKRSNVKERSTIFIVIQSAVQRIVSRWQQWQQQHHQRHQNAHAKYSRIPINFFISSLRFHSVHRGIFYLQEQSILVLVVLLLPIGTIDCLLRRAIQYPHHTTICMYEWGASVCFSRVPWEVLFFICAHATWMS